MPGSLSGLGLRLVSALVAGLVFALFWGGLVYGVGQARLGQVSEPDQGFAPFRWAALPAGRPVRVLLLGTSLTDRGDWPQTLQARLAACHPGGVVVERLAKPGANSAWGAAALQAYLQKNPKPDLLLAEFSGNDASLWRGMPLAKSRQQHEAILRAARAADLPVWLATMSPAFGRKAWERPGQVAYRALYADLARENGAGLVAMAQAWLDLPPATRRAALPDGLHPTNSAMKDIAVPQLFAALKPVLCP